MVIRRSYSEFTKGVALGMLLGDKTYKDIKEETVISLATYYRI
jgi:uncharacterized protein YerC